MKTTIIYLTGKQGSGKTTLIKSFKKGIELHSSDYGLTKMNHLLEKKVKKTLVYTSQIYSRETNRRLKLKAKQNNVNYFKLTI